jgi:RHS repeat-associated protein
VTCRCSLLRGTYWAPTRSYRVKIRIAGAAIPGQTRGGCYCRARYYHPRLQRFISEDPIEFLGGDVNLYGYVANNPLSFIDPLGLDRRPACDFAQTYTRVLKANVNETNALLFSPTATAVKTVAGLAFGTGTVVARSTGTVSPFDAVKSVVLHHRGVANLTIGATLASAAVNWGVNAGLSAVALEVGIITGSSYVALGQALAQCGF